MNGLHNKILELLKEIDAICKKYNITYYAAGGTTIGAIRHRGFIPWDDDADLYMTRDNFYKFRDAFKKEQPYGRVFGCLDDDEKYPGTIPRYIDDTSTIVAKFHCLNTCAAGVVIDIFVLDPVPNDPVLQEEHIGKLNIYADMVMPYYGYTNRANDKYLYMYDEYQRRAEIEGKGKIIEELEQDLFTMPEEQCDFYVLRWGTIPHIFEKSMFGEPIYFQYEDMQLPCPHRWYDYLVQLYGPKWMYIPPHIEDESHDFIVDINHKYTNYTIEADRFIPKEKGYEKYLRRKNLFIQREQLTRPLKNDVLKLNSEYILRSQNKYLSTSGIDIQKLNDECRYHEIVVAYKPYLDMQFSNSFVGKMNHANTYRYNNKVFIPLEDKQLIVLLNALLMTGQVKRCKDLIQLRKKAFAMDDRINNIEARADNIYELYKAFYSHQYDKVEKYLKTFDEEEKNTIIDIKKISIQNKILLEEDFEKIAQMLRVVKTENQYDGEFIKIEGDLHYREGNIKEAYKLYQEALPDLTNGLMMLDIKDKFNEIQLNYDTPIDLSKKTILQEKQLELLEEIDNICTSNEINYFLSGSTLLFGYYKHILGNEYRTNTIIMTPENALKFIEVCEKTLPSNRNIDYMLNNHLHNGHTIYYCDSNTLSLSWLKLKESRNIGIHITIYILKKKDRNIFRWLYTRGLDAVQTMYNRIKANKYKKESQKAKWIVYSIVAIIGQERLKNIVFNGYIKGALKNPNNDYYLSKNNYKRSIGKYYKKEYFENHRYTTIYDKKFRIPQDIETYIEDIHGKYAEERVKVRDGNLSMFKVADCNLVFDDIKDMAESEVFSAKKFENYLKGTALNPEIRRLNRTVKRYWNILLRGEDRFKLYLEYFSKKKEIIDLYKAKDFAKLEEIFIKYDKAVRKNLRRGLGLSFDNEIFEIYCKLLEYNGEIEMAKKLQAKIPEEHKEPIVIQ